MRAVVDPAGNARLAAACALATLLFGGCGVLRQVANTAVANQGLVGGAARAAASQLPVGEEEERAYGGAVAIEIVARHGGLVHDDALHRYVGLVGLAVASYSDRPALRWHFGVLESETVNAWSAPGGYVFVTRGLLAALNDEAELAAVLGHEVSHITERHAVDILQNLKSASALGSATGSSWKALADFQRVVDNYLRDYLERGMPRKLEFDADKGAVELLGRVGYRGAALIDVLLRLRQRPQAKAAGTATHPDLDARIERLRDLPAARVGGGVDARARFVAAIAASNERRSTPEAPPPAAEERGTPGRLEPGATDAPATPPAAGNDGRPERPD